MPVLALDVGERRIGIALSDAGETYALPLKTLDRSSLHEDLDAILAICGEYGVRTIVVGDPLTLSGERGIAAKKMDGFAEALGRAFDGAVVRIDERMTTALVTKQLIEADVSRAKRKRVVDQLAAASILDTYLARSRRR
jgi:putative Holliday junction resolvase